MKKYWSHIFDKSACLSKKQMKDYVENKMNPEERYVVEHHITGCLLCSYAIEGILHNEGSLVSLTKLNSEFLTAHLGLLHPEVHLNSITPALSSRINSSPKRRVHTPGTFKPFGLFSVLVLGLVIYLYTGNRQSATSSITSQTNATVEEVDIAAAKGKEEQPVVHSKKTETIQPTENLSSSSFVNISSSSPIQAEVIDKNIVVDRRESNTPAIKDKNETKVSDDVKESINQVPKTKEHADKNAQVATLNADELYASGRYNAALLSYRKTMNARGDRKEQYDALQAARCYLQTGQETAASELLEKLSQNGKGSSKRQARRLLKQMEKDTHQ